MYKRIQSINSSQYDQERKKPRSQTIEFQSAKNSNNVGEGTILDDSSGGKSDEGNS